MLWKDINKSKLHSRRNTDQFKFVEYFVPLTSGTVVHRMLYTTSRIKSSYKILYFHIRSDRAV